MDSLRPVRSPGHAFSQSPSRLAVVTSGGLMQVTQPLKRSVGRRVAPPTVPRGTRSGATRHARLPCPLDVGVANDERKETEHQRKDETK